MKKIKQDKEIEWWDMGRGLFKKSGKGNYFRGGNFLANRK